MGFTRLRLHADHTHPLESGTLKERMDLPHLAHRFDPWKRAQLTGSPHKGRGQTGSAIGRMNDDPLQSHELLIESQQRGAVPAPSMSEELVAQPERAGRRDEQADPDRLSVVPEQHPELHQADLVAAIMPPSEVRPVGLGGEAEPEFAMEGDGGSFFYSDEEGRGSSWFLVVRSWQADG